MFFWWICGGKSGFPILFLHHLRTALSMGFSKLEYWSGLPFPSPGDHPYPRIKPRSPASEAGSLPCEPPGTPWKKKKKTSLQLQKKKKKQKKAIKLTIIKNMGLIPWFKTFLLTFLVRQMHQQYDIDNLYDTILWQYLDLQMLLDNTFFALRSDKFSVVKLISANSMALIFIRLCLKN